MSEFSCSKFYILFVLLTHFTAGAWAPRHKCITYGMENSMHFDYLDGELERNGTHCIAVGFVLHYLQVHRQA